MKRKQGEVTRSPMAGWLVQRSTWYLYMARYVYVSCRRHWQLRPEASLKTIPPHARPVTGSDPGSPLPDLSGATGTWEPPPKKSPSSMRRHSVTGARGHVDTRAAGWVTFAHRTRASEPTLTSRVIFGGGGARLAPSPTFLLLFLSRSAFIFKRGFNWSGQCMGSQLSTDIRIIAAVAPDQTDPAARTLCYAGTGQLSAATWQNSQVHIVLTFHCQNRLVV
ncbi:hypothetical protein LY76DRAFT_268333 [Colletotrichum caudatum]|nr:hypothetical protein LY76DRAFT_268333 [Colletotrichum caudatum]